LGAGPLTAHSPSTQTIQDQVIALAALEKADELDVVTIDRKRAAV
jgi:hypothetical protein